MVKKGIAAFISTTQQNSIIALINPKDTDEGGQTPASKTILKHLGYEDSVVNHLQLLKDSEDSDYDTIDLEKRANMQLLSKRFFTVKTIEHMESFTLKFDDIDLMKKDFRELAQVFIKE